MARRIDHRRCTPTDKLKRERGAYVDTSAFIAFLDRSDSHHLLLNRLFSAPPPLATSALVIAEGHGWFLRRYDRHRANEFLAFIETLKPLTIQAFNEAELSKTRQVLATFSDRNLTLTDAHGLAVMKDLRRLRVLVNGPALGTYGCEAGVFELNCDSATGRLPYV